MDSSDKIVFISGSCGVLKLHNWAKGILNCIIKDNSKIVIGDAPGVDSLVQLFLSEVRYRNVDVYYTEKCRTNYGNWESHQIPVDKRQSEYSKENWTNHIAKDIEMSLICTHALTIWDGISKNTENNAMRVMSMGKEVVVVFSDDYIDNPIVGQRYFPHGGHQTVWWEEIEGGRLWHS